MTKLCLYKREDIPEDQLQYFEAVSGEELRKAGIPVPNL